VTTAPPRASGGPPGGSCKRRPGGPTSYRTPLIVTLSSHTNDTTHPDRFPPSLTTNDANPSAHGHQERRLTPPGVGKTHLAVALAVAACSAGYSIYFTSLDEAVRQLRAAEQAGRFAKKLQTYLRPAVLVLDEVGYLPLDRAAANMVFQLISRRYERGSVILTSNKAFSEWGSVFADDVLATAILDRLLHHCHVISINGPSYRLKDRASLAPNPNHVS
jgi:hypothetical protein